MTSIVIDASTAAKWQLSAEPEADRARDMLRDYAAGKIAFVAPKVWHYEIANIFNKAVGTRRITEGEGREAFTLLQASQSTFSTGLPRQTPTSWPGPIDVASTTASI